MSLMGPTSPFRNILNDKCLRTRVDTAMSTIKIIIFTQYHTTKCFHRKKVKKLPKFHVKGWV